MLEIEDGARVERLRLGKWQYRANPTARSYGTGLMVGSEIGAEWPVGQVSRPAMYQPAVSPSAR
jgi:hypothetical protein